MSTVELRRSHTQHLSHWNGRSSVAIVPVPKNDDELDLVVTSPDLRRGKGAVQTISTVRPVDILRDIILETPTSHGLMLLEDVQEPLPLAFSADVIVVAPGGDRYDITTTTTQRAADMAVFWAGVARRLGRLDAEEARRAEAEAREEAEAAKVAHEARIEDLARKLHAAGESRAPFELLADRYRAMAALAIDELETDR